MGKALDLAGCPIPSCLITGPMVGRWRPIIESLGVFLPVKYLAVSMISGQGFRGLFSKLSSRASPTKHEKLGWNGVLDTVPKL